MLFLYIYIVYLKEDVTECQRILRELFNNNGDLNMMTFTLK